MHRTEMPGDLETRVIYVSIEEIQRYAESHLNPATGFRLVARNMDSPINLVVHAPGHGSSLSSQLLDIGVQQ